MKSKTCQWSEGSSASLAENFLSYSVIQVKESLVTILLWSSYICRSSLQKSEREKRRIGILSVISHTVAAATLIFSEYLLNSYEYITGASIRNVFRNKLFVARAKVFQENVFGQQPPVLS